MHMPRRYPGFVEVAISSGSRAFDELRDGLARDPQVRSELENAFRLNVERVNPTDPGNRFIVGGAIEWLIAAAAWSLGVLTLPGGHSARGFDLLDLQDAARGLWSVKAQTGASAGQWRITNGLGGAGKGFVEPTVFVAPHLPGLVFVDPAQHLEVSSEAQAKNDAVILPARAVRIHAQRHPECVAPLVAPVNEGRGRENPFLSYAQTLVNPGQFPRLSRMFEDATPRSGGAVAEVAELVSLRSTGQITDQQFHALVNRIAGLE